MKTSLKSLLLGAAFAAMVAPVTAKTTPIFSPTAEKNTPNARSVYNLPEEALGLHAMNTYESEAAGETWLQHERAYSSFDDQLPELNAFPFNDSPAMSSSTDAQQVWAISGSNLYTRADDTWTSRVIGRDNNITPVYPNGSPFDDAVQHGNVTTQLLLSSNSADGYFITAYDLETDTKGATLPVMNLGLNEPTLAASPTLDAMIGGWTSNGPEPRNYLVKVADNTGSSYAIDETKTFQLLPPVRDGSLDTDLMDFYAIALDGDGVRNDLVTLWRYEMPACNGQVDGPGGQKDADTVRQTVVAQYKNVVPQENPTTGVPDGFVLY